MKQITILAQPAALNERRQRHQQIFRTALLLSLPLALVVGWGSLNGSLPVWWTLFLPLPVLLIFALWERRRRQSSRYEAGVLALLCLNGVAFNVLRLMGTAVPSSTPGSFADLSLLLLMAGVFLFQRPRWVLATAAPYAGFHLMVNLILTLHQPSAARWVNLLMLMTTLALFSLLYMYRRWWEEAHESQRRYQTLAFTDELTTLPNRRALQGVWKTYSARDQVAVMMVDIDHFKQVNDRYGHAEGDRLLWLVGQLISAQLAEHSTLTPPMRAQRKARVGRWGGEEFLVLLPNSTPTLAFMMAEAIREAVEHSDAGVPLTVSLGVALRRGGEDLADTAVRADAALYRAKHSGRNRVVLYEDSGTDPNRQTAELIYEEHQPVQGTPRDLQTF
ncbi:GGDEF domain-containing protein [Deinococcus sp.]|uniref:GGDEF domain-containing protein n=1 Tax=Deinococcus sp. TaxID=47478 RepID=UPI0025FEE848|nr:GGDEF domain-containing protein [Deinococcus sp.]